jgi:hypothetical protein
MRSLAIAVLLAACTPPQARRAHRVGEVGTAVGLVGILGSVTGAALVPSQEDTLTTVGLAFVPVALVGALVYIGTDRFAGTDHHERHLTMRERQRATAWELTKQAKSAARSRDCTQVTAIDPRVHELDADFHDVVFMRDVAIKRCLRTGR